MLYDNSPTPRTYTALQARRKALACEIMQQEKRMRDTLTYDLSPYRIAHRIGRYAACSFISTVSSFRLLHNLWRTAKVAIRYIKRLTKKL